MSAVGRALVVVLSLVLLSREALAQQVSMPRWQGGVAFDSSVRAALRAPTAPERKVADDVSTALLATMVAAPIVAGGARTLAAHGSFRDFAGLTLVSAEAFGVAFGLMYLAKSTALRERPYATAAGLATYCTTHASDPSCGSDRNASFFSGHSAIAFTGAGLLCTQQIFFGPLVAGSAAGGTAQTAKLDALGCAGGMIAATATAMLRIVADMHYASDTLAGAAIGLGAGMLLPYILHFAPWAPLPIARSMRANEPSARKSPLVGLHVTPWGGPGGGGIAIGAQFQ